MQGEIEVNGREGKDHFLIQCKSERVVRSGDTERVQREVGLRKPCPAVGGRA